MLVNEIPKFFIDAEAGLLSISGISIMEDPNAFYRPLYEKIRGYLEKPAPQSIVVLDMEYINSGSMKWLFNLLQLFDSPYLEGHAVLVKFFYDDEDILENGRHLESCLTIPFVFSKKMR